MKYHSIAPAPRRTTRRPSTLVSRVVSSLLLAFPLLSQAGTYKSISIDGSFADWAGVPKAYSDAQEGANATDYKDVYVAHDDRYLYIRFSTYSSGNPFTSRNNIFLDADADGATGFKANGGQVGSELLIQSGAGYQEKNGGFNEGGVNGLDWQSAANASNTEFEVRISRSATYATDGSPVFLSDTIAFILEAETPTFSPIEFAPDSGNGGIAYEFTPPPGPFPSGQLELVALTTSTWSLLANRTAPDESWATLDFDPSISPGWSTGQGLFGFTTTQGIYPAIQTGFSPSSTSAYLRTTFNWDYDPSGVVLVLKSYLSDGAAIFLNGTEIKRVRLPQGPLSLSTRALSAPPTPGTTEQIALPASALITGQNVIAIELHDQSTPDGSLVFGATLLATDAYPAFINSPDLPADALIREGNPLTLTVEAAGSAPIAYQWFKNNVPIPGATSASFTLPLVLSTDGGSYYVEVSNTLVSNVRSRSASITTFADPVQITNPALPADLSLLTGQSATFTVETAGSPPITFQWFHNNQSIQDATNATLTLPSVKVSDAGSYHVIVANRLAATARSRSASLNVSDDRIPPSITSILGSSTSVTLTFSEPITASTAEILANYTIDGGLTLSKATWGGPTQPNIVRLTTSPQTVGTPHILIVSNIRDLFGNTLPLNTQVPFRSTIVIDGSFDDWAGATPIEGDPQDSSDSSDWNEVYLANDDEYLYVRIVLHNTATWPTSFFYNNFYFNTDDSNLTGNRSYGNVGAEMLIQGGAGYQEKNGGFNEGGIDNLGWSIAPESTSNEFEFRVSRKATYNSDGLPVFTGAKVSMVLEAENTSYQMRDLSPNTGSFEYILQPETLGRLNTSPAPDGGFNLSWNNEAILQYRDSLTDGDWQDDPDQTNPKALTPGSPTRYYRLYRPDPTQ